MIQVSFYLDKLFIFHDHDWIINIDDYYSKTKNRLYNMSQITGNIEVTQLSY